MKLNNLPAAQIKQDFIQFTGGLDVVSPPISIPSGFVRRSYNFEEDVNGGYAGLTGYERFSGKTSPSSGVYSTLAYSVAGTVAVGNTITGATSGATAVVLAITATYFVVTKTTGTWVSESTTTYGATVTGPAYPSSETGALGAEYLNLAADSYRSDIAAVPGSGSILGVWYYKGVVYAFRNNAGATAVDMYKSSTSGWVNVALGYEVYFSAGSGTAPAEGATITKGAVSGVLKRLVIESGTFAGATAAGRMIFASITGTPFTAGAFTAGIAATCVSQATITMPNISGRFEFVNANFTGSIDTLRMYGCDGQNRGFEFDGTTFVPINTGLSAALDKPTHVIEHQNHLFFANASSIFNSAIGDPYNWTALLGAAEIALSDTVTGFKGQPGGDTTAAMAIYCRNKTYVLYGTSATSWQSVKFNDQGGAIPYSIQKIGQTFVLDDRGVTSLNASQQFGNFAESTISRRVKTYLSRIRGTLSDSHVARDKQQYRLFFNEGTALYWTIGAKVSSMMPMLFPNPVLCSCSDETYGGGDEVIFFGSDNGYVYQMEKGTSFDGSAIDCYLEFVFNNSKAYRQLKKYRRVTLEVMGSGYAEWNVSYFLNYNSVDSAQPDETSYAEDLSQSAYWDEFFWDEFAWDGEQVASYTLSTPGDGDNMALRIISSSDEFTPVKFSGAFIEYSALRMKR